MKPRKRIMVLIGVLLCLCVTGGAVMDSLTKAQLYQTGLDYLSAMTEDDAEKAIAYFTSAGNHGQAKSFAMYAQALLEIFRAEEDRNNLTTAEMRLEMLDMPEFTAELAAYELPSLEELQTYITARRYEIEGDTEAAIATYAKIVNTLDAMERRMNLAFGQKDADYRKAVSLFEAGDYIGAARLFQELKNWKDSSEMYEKCMALHEHMWIAATCLTPKTCSACGATEGGALGHTWKAATCTEPKTCTRCGTTEGSALGHAWKDATCTEPKTCSRCGLTEGKGQNHDWRAATCTEPKTCKRCGITEGKPLGHNWRAATCTDPKTCTRCGAVEGKALGHTWKAATCTTAKTCTRCGTTEGKALGHTWKAATCTTAKTCTRCGTTEGKALGHSWKAATCTTPKTCTRCGTTEGKALGHDWQAATYTAPKTCKRCGKTEGTKLATSFTKDGIVRYGHYEQDNKTANGPEEIEWLVLDIDEAKHRALLISRYGLDAKPYNKTNTSITWEKCTLRAWLNKDFLSVAFTEKEQSVILTTIIDNSKGQGYWGTDGGNNTQDKIFLLSYAEANKYLGVTYGVKTNMGSRTSPTAYAIKNGAWTSSGDQTAEGTAAGWWWLRSPGIDQRYAARVYTDGSLSRYDVDYYNGTVRPALWLDLDADIY